MTDHKIEEYTFLGLSNHGKPLKLIDSLAYLISLVDSPENKITNPDVAANVLAIAYDADEQISVSERLSWQEQVLPKGYYPQTPAMLTQKWSPIAAMLDQGFSPLVLRRDPSSCAAATGIWGTSPFRSSKSIGDCITVQELFWSVLGKAFCRAGERELLVSIVAQPGWSYERGVGVLENLADADLILADKILWQRTPDKGRRPF